MSRRATTFRELARIVQQDVWRGDTSGLLQASQAPDACCPVSSEQENNAVSVVPRQGSVSTNHFNWRIPAQGWSGVGLRNDIVRRPRPGGDNDRNIDGRTMSRPQAGNDADGPYHHGVCLERLRGFHHCISSLSAVRVRALVCVG